MRRSRVPRAGVALAVAVLVVSAVGGARADSDLESTLACATLTVPDTPRVWSVSFATISRDGAERKLRANLFSRRDDGSPLLVTRITFPEDLAGSRLFMFERGGATQIFLQTSDMERPKRVQGEHTSMSVFGTDFAYEDFERIYGMNRPGETRRLEDSTVGGRAVRVLEIEPAGGESSAYTHVRAFVDEETCVPLRMEFYAPATRMRKLLTVDPQELRSEGDTYIAHSMHMQDLIDGSETRLIVLSQRPTTAFPEIPEVPAARVPAPE